MVKLNWEIGDLESRLEFIQTIDLEKLSATSLERVADYLLWGKDESGQNATDEGIEIATRHATWQKKPESLEALVERADHRLSDARSPGQAPHKAKRETFSRDTARMEAPPEILDELEDLWTSIDTLEFQIATRKHSDGSQKKPPREEVRDRLENPEELAAEALRWTQAQLSRAKHRLVELRTQQYTLRDDYKPTAFVDWRTRLEGTPSQPWTTDDWLTLPFPIPSDDIFPILYQPLDTMRPPVNSSLEPWLKNHCYTVAATQEVGIDWASPAHWDALIKNWLYFSDEPSTQRIIDIANYYMRLADLTRPQSLVLGGKIGGFSNKEIREVLVRAGEKDYATNYISTIYTQQALQKLCAAAEKHEAHIWHLVNHPTEWKKCTSCGIVKPKTTTYFRRNRQRKDGWNTKCQECVKEAKKK